MHTLAAIAGAIGLVVAPPSDPVSVTPGWAGYVVRTSGSIETVTGTWIQPRVVCNRPDSSVAFWVGLGGASPDSAKVEQVGTSADCSSRARDSYSAWYQLFPARAVSIPVIVRPGDLITAEVSVVGNTVTLSLRNVSTGAAFSAERSMRAPESDSAEWIVEAPVVCFATCARMPLAQFERAHFSNAFASARSAGAERWEGRRFEFRSGRTIVRPLAFSGDRSSFDVVRLTARSRR